MSGWAWMVIELRGADMLLAPTVGPDNMDRDEAHQAVQDMLDRVPQFASVAAKWRDGAKDDTVYAGAFTWAIFPHDGDTLAAAHRWLEDYAAIMRTGGVDVSVARPR